MHTTTPQAEIGSVSTGTLHSIDLLTALADELRRLDVGGAHADLLKECDDEMVLDRLNDGDDDIAADLADRLIDALAEFAPPFCYFGAHPGDGADFGFWPIDPMDIADEVLRVDDLPEYILHTNDHGNVELYRVSLESVWGIV